MFSGKKKVELDLVLDYVKVQLGKLFVMPTFGNGHCCLHHQSAQRMGFTLSREMMFVESALIVRS